jgi:hypothetical protein
MKNILKLLNSQKNTFLWIYKNPINFFCPVIVEIIFMFFTMFFTLNINFTLLIIFTFFEINSVLLVSSFHLINYCNVRLKKILLLKIFLCCVINLILFGIIEYFKWGLDINRKYLFILSNFIYILMTIILTISFNKEIIKKDIIKNIAGIIILYLIMLVFLIFILIFFQNKFQYNLDKKMLDRLIKVLQLIIVNVYTFSIIVYICDKRKV